MSAQHVYVVLETVHDTPVSVSTFEDKDRAREHFTRMVKQEIGDSMEDCVDQDGANPDPASPGCWAIENHATGYRIRITQGTHYPSLEPALA